jgi:hypothetical protein
MLLCHDCIVICIGVFRECLTATSASTPGSGEGPWPACPDKRSCSSSSNFHVQRQGEKGGLLQMFYALAILRWAHAGYLLTPAAGLMGKYTWQAVLIL